MKICKFGLDNFFFGLAIAILFLVLPLIFNFPSVVVFLFWILGIFILFFSFWFFRDPRRNIPLLAIEDSSIVLAPADGKVIEIKEVEQAILKQKVIQVSIFLSPLDVHVNRSPITGSVFYFHYFPGKKLVAYHPKASEENEHTFICVKNEFGSIAFKQIAGILARRVVCVIKEGDNINAGDKIGMMKFGSRMDVFLPTNSRIFVKVWDKVRGGETIIARLQKEYEFPNI